MSTQKELSAYPAAGIEVRQIQRYAGLHGRRILEVGCGDGRLTLQLARQAASVLALDPDPRAIADARKTAATWAIRNVGFLVEFGEDVRPRGVPFDLAVFSWSL